MKQTNRRNQENTVNTVNQKNKVYQITDKPISKLKASLLVLMISFVVFQITTHLTIVFTESINATLLWEVDSQPQFGDYGNYPLDTIHLSAKSTLNNITENKTKNADYIVVTKKVACVSGQTLWSDGLAYYCDGVQLGFAKTTTRKGEVLNPFQYNGIIPDGKLFLLGEHKDSFDSRYWGFADASLVKKAIKII